MMNLSKRHREVALIIIANPGVSSSDIRKRLSEVVSLVTVKRDITFLHKAKYVTSTGKGRSVTYTISPEGKLFFPFDAHEYASVDPDRRPALRRFDSGLFPSVPESLFNDAERSLLDGASAGYRRRSEDMSASLHEKELQRFIVELSWKSSKIEGNTYTLLDTERLIREGIEAPHHTGDEARMILNHKTAFDFVLANKGVFKHTIGRAAVEEIHKLLVHDLGVGMGIRNRVVGITGTVYQPLDNAHQIREALEGAYAAINRMADPYSAALLSLLAISYVQPFEDGNKRTARLVANAILVARECAPLSYRSVEEVAYREALIVFYEVQSLEPLKRIFIEQYQFAAQTYMGV